MNPVVSRVLLIEDNLADAHLFGELLREAGARRLELSHVTTLAAALERLSHDEFDVALVDLSLPDASGIEAIVCLHAEHPSLPLVVVTGFDDEATAARAVREGAQDYLVKGQADGHLLLRAMSYASERRRAIEVLQRREEHFRSLIENALDLVAIVQPDGVFRYASPSHQRILGWSAEELIGVNVNTLVAPEDQAIVAGMFRDGVRHSFEYRLRHKDGNWRVVESYARNFSQVAGVGGIVVNSRDVTEHRLLEQQALQAQKMDAIARLASGIAHDFNNLLTVIAGYTNLLLLRCTSDDAARSDLEQVARAADRAAELTRQLLAFSRRQLAPSSSVDIGALIGEAQPILTRVAGDSVKLTASLADKLPSVCADPGQIEQVLLNLTLNARDAMPDGGEIAMEASFAALNEEAAALAGVKPGNYVAIRVGDNGAGMAPEVQARIFEPFFTTKEQGKGTGLGLSTSYGIIRQTGGNLTVASEPGQGTVFTIWLPAESQALPD